MPLKVYFYAFLRYSFKYIITFILLFKIDSGNVPILEV